MDSFLNGFRKFLGFGRRDDGFNNENPERDRHWNDRQDSQFNRFFQQDEQDNDPSHSFSFNVFSDPIEMHRYFEHQMNEMLKSFGMVGEDSFFGAFDPFGKMPAIEQQPPVSSPANSRDLRDQFLKPGYHSTTSEDDKHKVDGDVDGKVNIGELDSILKGENNRLSPYRGHSQVSPHQVQPRIQFFGQSVTSKTIRNPDGTIETHRSIRNQDGSEETTVSRRRGDQEYTVITKKDKNGQQETIENLVNLDEKDVGSFLKGNCLKSGDDVHQPQSLPDKLPSNWFPFDKYFR